MKWKQWIHRRIEGIEEDANYLVSYKEDDGKYCLPHRAYYCDGKMFLNDSMTAFPIAPDIYMEMPQVPK